MALTARRLVVSHQCILGDHALICGASHHYLCHVLRLSVGAELVLLDGTGWQYEGKIEHINIKEVRVRIDKRIAPLPCSRPRLILLYGLSRRERTELVLQKATELGVDWILPCVCERSLAKLPLTSAKLERWEKIIASATRQCGRSSSPLLSTPMSLGEALDEMQGASISMMATPQGTPLSHVKCALETSPPPDEVALIVGPEGGFTENEIHLAQKRHVCLVTLGPLILRTETAAIVFLSLVAFLTRRL